MRRDEQRSPVLVLLASMPSPRARDRGDGERVVGRGTMSDLSTEATSIHLSTVQHPSISFRLASGGGGGVGVYQPALGRQGRQGKAKGKADGRQRGRAGQLCHQTVVVEV
jgi:hypothetical protein